MGLRLTDQRSSWLRMKLSLALPSPILTHELLQSNPILQIPQNKRILSNQLVILVRLHRKSLAYKFSGAFIWLLPNPSPWLSVINFVLPITDSINRLSRIIFPQSLPSSFLTMFPSVIQSNILLLVAFSPPSSFHVSWHYWLLKKKAKIW